MMRARALLTLTAALWLAACASVAPRDEVGPFDLVGRVFVGQDGRSFSSNLRWNHETGVDQIWLMSPLGQTLAYIEDGRSGATLTSADRQEYHAASVENLTDRALGWALPLAELRYWVRGEEVPGMPAQDVQRVAGGPLLELTQNGWHIAFTPPPPGSADRRPQRLQITRGGQQIRLVIDEWRATTPPP